jgi:nucleoid-associated protein YgaU
MPKSLLQRIGDLLGGAEQAAKNKEEAAKQAAEAARQEAERLKREAEAKAADLQRQMEEKERQAEAAAREAAQAPSAAAEVKATAAAGRTYVVKSGDTLSGIAYDVYGDAGRWPEIFEANRDKIKDPNLIHPGQELRIP